MGFFQKIFVRKKQTEVQKSKELIALFDLEHFMSSLLTGDHYVAKSEYLNILKEKKASLSGFPCSNLAARWTITAKRT